VVRYCIVSFALACGSGYWPAAQALATPTIVVLGDSLSAEYGLPRGSGWVALLERKLAAEKIAFKVVNASISGDTTSGGRSRLPALLKQQQPAIVVIELGGNDALRGLPLTNTQANLTAMVEASKQAGAKVLLLGIQVPPNYGSDYANKFAATFQNVSKALQVPLVPFLLAHVADGPDPVAMFQSDRIHPKAEAHPQILANVWPALGKLLK